MSKSTKSESNHSNIDKIEKLKNLYWVLNFLKAFKSFYYCSRVIGPRTLGTSTYGRRKGTF
jgi:hypothetical protein